MYRLPRILSLNVHHVHILRYISTDNASVYHTFKCTAYKDACMYIDHSAMVRVSSNDSVEVMGMNHVTSELSSWMLWVYDIM